MPKQILTGTLEEQCAFLYNLAQQKAAVGNYSGATHALKEILKYKPDYPGAAELMAQAKAGKRQQRFLLWFSLGGAIAGVFVGTLRGFSNDLWLLGLGAVGGLVGFGVGNLFAGRTPMPTGNRPPRNAETTLPVQDTGGSRPKDGEQRSDDSAGLDNRSNPGPGTVPNPGPDAGPNAGPVAGVTDGAAPAGVDSD